MSWMRRAVLPCAVLLIAMPAPAEAAVTSTFASGTLTVTVDAADDVAVTVSGGNVKINGADPSSGAVAASAINALSIVTTGDFANHVDLTGMSAATFPGLASGGIVVNVGEGADEVDGSPLPERVTAASDGDADDFDGNGGTDAIVVLGLDDSDFVLDVDSLTGEGVDVVVEFDEAEIFGGDGDNAVDGTGFPGPITFESMGGNDVFTPSSVSPFASRMYNFTAGGGNDRILLHPEDSLLFFADAFQVNGLGSVTVNGLERVEVMGGPDANFIDFYNWGGAYGVMGGGGDDTFTPSNTDGVVDRSFDGGPGTNVVEVYAHAGGTLFVVTDSLLSGPSQTNLANVHEVFVLGDDGNDTLHAPLFSGYVRLDGGKGDDTLIAPGNPADLTERDPATALNAFLGGDGFDRLVRAGDRNVVADAGALRGPATLFFSGLESLALDGGPSGNTLDGSAFPGLLEINGLGGDDTITLSSSPGGAVFPRSGTTGYATTGRGGDGDDTITGGGGADALYGESGTDTLSGGGGADLLDCGGNVDTLIRDAADTVANCTAAPAPSPTPAPTPTPVPEDTVAPAIAVTVKKTVTLTAKGEMTVTVACPAADRPGCAGKATLKTARAVDSSAVAAAKRVVTLASKAYTAPAGQSVKVRLKLSRKNLRLVRRLRKVAARLTVTGKDAAGNGRTVTKTLVVRARR